MNPTSSTSAALRGDYETADRIAVENLDLMGTTHVRERQKTPSACPHIERVVAVERCTDGLHRLWLDGDGGLAREGRATVAWPSTGFESAERAVREARNLLDRT